MQSQTNKIHMAKLHRSLYKTIMKQILAKPSTYQITIICSYKRLKLYLLYCLNSLVAYNYLWLNLLREVVHFLVLVCSRGAKLVQIEITEVILKRKWTITVEKEVEKNKKRHHPCNTFILQKQTTRASLELFLKHLQIEIFNFQHQERF